MSISTIAAKTYVYTCVRRCLLGHNVEEKVYMRDEGGREGRGHCCHRLLVSKATFLNINLNTL